MSLLGNGELKTNFYLNNQRKNVEIFLLWNIKFVHILLDIVENINCVKLRECKEARCE